MYYQLLMAIYNEKKGCVVMYTPFQSANLKKKLLIICDSWQTPFISITFVKDDIPQNYLPVEPDKLYDAYKQYYRKFEKMSNVRKNMAPLRTTMRLFVAKY
jgi:hypothetical protein